MRYGVPFVNTNSHLCFVSVALSHCFGLDCINGNWLYNDLWIMLNIVSSRNSVVKVAWKHFSMLYLAFLFHGEMYYTMLCRIWISVNWVNQGSHFNTILICCSHLAVWRWWTIADGLAKSSCTLSYYYNVIIISLMYQASISFFLTLFHCNAKGIIPIFGIV